MEDLHAAAEEIIHMTSILDDSHPPLTPEQNPIRYAFQVNWYRFREVCYNIVQKEILNTY